MDVQYHLKPRDAGCSDGSYRKLKGYFLVLVGMSVYSFDALLIELSNTSGAIVAFWRGFFTFLTLAMLFFFRNRDRSLTALKEGGWPMLLSGLLWGVSGFCFSLGVRLAGAPVALVLLGTAPLMAAVFSTVLLREKPSRTTSIAILLSMGGVYFMYREGLVSGQLTGTFFTILTPIASGLNFTTLRRHPHTSRVGISMLGGLFSAIFGIAMSGGHITLPFASLRYLMVLGCLILPFGQVMLSNGTRYLTAPETSLLKSSEIIFGLFYVWLFLGQLPSRDNLIGGAIVLCAMLLHLWGAARTPDSTMGRIRKMDI